jgi:hypothetical protein
MWTAPLSWIESFGRAEAAICSLNLILDVLLPCRMVLLTVVVLPMLCVRNEMHARVALGEYHLGNRPKRAVTLFKVNAKLARLHGLGVHRAGNIAEWTRTPGANPCSRRARFAHAG